MDGRLRVLLTPDSSLPLPYNRPCSLRRFSLFSGSFPFPSVVPLVPQSANRFSGATRLRMAAAALCLIVPLGVACWLRPDSNGFGTHRQLGLPPCTSVWLFGVRCPSCGMTTSWSHAVRGHWLQAIGANTGGTLLAAMAMIAGPWLLISAARGRWFVGRPGDRLLALAAGLVIAATLLDWTYRLMTQG